MSEIDDGARLLGGLVPDVVVVETFTSDPAAAVLPEEAALVAAAPPERRRAFAAARSCARRALVQLGVAPGPILLDPDAPAWAYRAPRWPAGVVGSMTHCDGYHAAAVARSATVAAVGIDAEPNAPLPAVVRDLVTLDEERAALARLSGARPDVAWDRLVFSAKESVYKAWFPLTRRWLDFGDCLVRPGLDGTFTAELRVRPPVFAGVAGRRLTGRWRTTTRGGRAYVATALTVPAFGAGGGAVR
ncbi:4'-phosphopantetheinyl transferase family protein [Georgenia thermotolerans]|uniref:4'-phosphopantetheinyl transferase family protein n=1 Tax=Georgenia thermotolerans TaxID=527326 RepID=UPI001B8C0BA3|nr:4'-phosphopantetheinyl transferase superfamily protein [Georgenia thermotolerans]